MYIATYTTDLGATFKYMMVAAANLTLAYTYISIDIDPAGGIITQIERI
jgi:hypothetical protein